MQQRCESLGWKKNRRVLLKGRSAAALLTLFAAVHQMTQNNGVSAGRVESTDNSVAITINNGFPLCHFRGGPRQCWLLPSAMAENSPRAFTHAARIPKR